MSAPSLPSPKELLNPHTEAIFDATPSGIVVIDHNRCIAHSNRAASSLFHWDPAAIRGQSAEFLMGKVPAPRTGGRVSALLQLPMDEGARSEDEMLQRHDGSEFAAQVDLNPLDTTSGRWYLATIADMSEQQRLKADIQKLEQAVEEASQKVLQLMQAPAAVAPVKRPQDKLTDPLTQLGNKDFFLQVLATKNGTPAGWNAIVFTVRHLRVLSDRLGKTVAERLLLFVSQYITRSLSNPEDVLFRWEGATMVALLKRSALADARQEASEICGRRLEHLIERGSGGSALVLVSIASSTLSLDGLRSEQVVQRIEQAAIQAFR